MSSSVLGRRSANFGVRPRASQARELAATRGEVERLSRLIALDLARPPATPTTATTAAPPEAPEREPQAAAQVADTIAPPSPVELEALKAASTILREALSTGRWTVASSLRFREQLAGVGENDKAALMTELTTAPNTDKLHMEGPPGPF